MAQRPAPASRKGIKEILAEYRVAAPVDLATAEEESQRTGELLHQVLVTHGHADKTAVLQALAKEWRVSPISIDEIEVRPEVVRLIPDATERKNHLLPFIKEDGVLLVAMADPRDPLLLEDIRLKTGLEVRPYLAMPADIHRELDRVYGTSLEHGDQPATDDQLRDLAEERTRELMESLKDTISVETVEERTDLLEVDASAPEVERIINALILGAIQQKASDIHIEPFDDPTGKKPRVIVRFRIDGFLKEAPFRIPWGYRQAVLAKIKIMTQTMNLTERRIPQSGRIQVVAKGRPIEFRVETVPTVYGESASMRLLDRKAVQVDITKLGFLPDILESLQEQIKGVGGKKNYGMILVTGPTGSGKTTTLYACLNQMNRPDIRIITAENPVEYNIDGIVQVQVNPDLSLGQSNVGAGQFKVFNFATALRSFLRLDPDVIMVGEIRDKETAQIAMEAAMTGHLMLSTLHTNDACSTVLRLVEMGPPPYLVASTLKCVLAQRLVRVICPNCKAANPPTADEKEIFRIHGFTLPDDAVVCQGQGCGNCGGTGFRGRAGMHELLLMDEFVRRAALADLTADNIRNAAIYESPQRMRTIIQDGLIKVLQGVTTMKEVLGVVAEKGAG